MPLYDSNVYSITNCYFRAESSERMFALFIFKCVKNLLLVHGVILHCSHTQLYFMKGLHFYKCFSASIAIFVSHSPHNAT